MTVTELVVKITAKEKRIASLNQRLQNWRDELADTATYSSRARIIKARINDIRTELEIEGSILYQLKDSLEHFEVDHPQ